MSTVTEIDCLTTTDHQMTRNAAMIDPTIKDDVQALLWRFNCNVKKTKLEILQADSPTELSSSARARQKRVRKNRARSINRWKKKVREQNANPTIEDTKETIKVARERISSTVTTAFKLARSPAPLGQKQLAQVGNRLVCLFRGRYRKLSKKLLNRYITEQ